MAEAGRSPRVVDGAPAGAEGQLSYAAGGRPMDVALKVAEAASSHGQEDRSGGAGHSYVAGGAQHVPVVVVCKFVAVLQALLAAVVQMAAVLQVFHRYVPRVSVAQKFARKPQGLVAADAPAVEVVAVESQVVQRLVPMVVAQKFPDVVKFVRSWRS